MHSLSSHSARLAAVALTLAAGSFPVSADERSVMLLVDGSGSMWGRIAPDRPAKIDIVRERLGAILAAPGKSRVGLASFGHRRKGDCSDAEIIATPDANREPVAAALQKLNPRGKGPVTLALRKALEALNGMSAASAILIQDGPDNCQQDTCAAAAEIAASAPSLKIHTIGIGIDAQTRPRIACVAEATGGTYFDAKDADTLLAAIDSAARLAMLADDAQPESAAEPAKSRPTTRGETALRASVALSEGGTPLTEPVHWRILEPGRAAVLAESDSPSLKAKLDPGQYEIAASIAGITARKTIDVAAGQETVVVVPLEAGRLKYRVSDIAGGEPSRSVHVAVTPEDAARGTRLATGSEGNLLLPEGSYTVSAVEGPIRREETVTIAAGAEKPVAIALSAGRLAVSLAPDSTGKRPDGVVYVISEDDPDSPSGRRDVARSAAPDARFTLPAGTYYVTARVGESELRERIAVGAGDDIKRVLTVPIVPLKATVRIAGGAPKSGMGIVYSVTALDEGEREIARSIAPELDIRLPAGRYRVAARLAAHKLVATSEVTLEAEKPAALVLDVSAAEVVFAPAGSESLPSGELRWDVRDERGRPVWHGSGPEPTAFIPPGRFTVRLEARDVVKEAAFEVAGGEHKRVEVGSR